jgi:hypothetical protein
MTTATTLLNRAVVTLAARGARGARGERPRCSDPVDQ